MYNRGALSGEGQTPEATALSAAYCQVKPALFLVSLVVPMLGMAAGESATSSFLRPAVGAAERVRAREGDSSLRFEGVSLGRIVSLAKRVPPSEIELSPDLAALRFDGQIRASSHEEVAERLSLTLRRDVGLEFVLHQREREVFVLRNAHDEAWLVPSRESTPHREGANGRFAGRGVPIRELAHFVSRLIGKPIVDETGLEGTYDFVLEWDPSAGAYALLQGFDDLGLELVRERRTIPVWVAERVQGSNE